MVRWLNEQKSWGKKGVNSPHPKKHITDALPIIIECSLCFFVSGHETCSASSEMFLNLKFKSQLQVRISWWGAKRGLFCRVDPNKVSLLRNRFGQPEMKPRQVAAAPNCRKYLADTFLFVTFSWLFVSCILF